MPSLILRLLANFANKIIKKVHDISPLYQLATKYNVKGTLSIPYYDESSSTITMAYATEFKSLESTSGKFLSIELKGFLAGALSKIAKSLVNNSQFDIVSEVINIMADSIARWIENELINGTDNKIQGLRGVTQTVTSAAATALTADELIDVQEEDNLIDAGIDLGQVNSNNLVVKTVITILISLQVITGMMQCSV